MNLTEECNLLTSTLAHVPPGNGHLDIRDWTPILPSTDPGPRLVAKAFTRISSPIAEAHGNSKDEVLTLLRDQMRDVLNSRIVTLITGMYEREAATVSTYLTVDSTGEDPVEFRTVTCVEPPTDVPMWVGAGSTDLEARVDLYRILVREAGARAVEAKRVAASARANLKKIMVMMRTACIPLRMA